MGNSTFYWQEVYLGRNVKSHVTRMNKTRHVTHVDESAHNGAATPAISIHTLKKPTYIYVYMYLCISIYMYIHMYICMYIHMYTYIHVYVRIDLYMYHYQV